MLDATDNVAPFCAADKKHPSLCCEIGGSRAWAHTTDGVIMVSAIADPPGTAPGQIDCCQDNLNLIRKVKRIVFHNNYRLVLALSDPIRGVLSIHTALGRSRSRKERNSICCGKARAGKITERACIPKHALHVLVPSWSAHSEDTSFVCKVSIRAAASPGSVRTIANRVDTLQAGRSVCEVSRAREAGRST
jgi:hypothetical protein